MNQEEFISQLKELYARNVQVALDKNSDYANDDDPFKNFRACERHGIPLPFGILVRMEDKMARLGNLLWKEPSVVGENVLDTALDLANYAAILAVWWENERKSAEENVVARSRPGYNDRLLSGVGGTVDRFSFIGDTSKS